MLLISKLFFLVCMHAFHQTTHAYLGHVQSIKVASHQTAQVAAALVGKKYVLPTQPALSVQHSTRGKEEDLRSAQAAAALPQSTQPASAVVGKEENVISTPASSSALVGGERDDTDTLSLLQSHGTIERVCSGIIVPPIPRGIHSFECGAMYNSSDVLVKASQRWLLFKTYWYKNNPYPPRYKSYFAKAKQKLDVKPDDRVLFVHGVGHYGHFLFETISRFWPMLYQEFHVVVIIWHGDPNRAAAETVSKLLAEYLGVKPPRVIHVPYMTPLKFDTCVYTAGYCFGDEKLLPPLYHTLSKTNKVVPKFHIGKLVYCIRESGFGFHQNYGKIWDEKPLATMFEKEFGFSVIEPGNFTFREQLSIFGNADILVGRVGTAMHNALFSLNPNVHVIILSDDRTTNSLQTDIFKMMELRKYQFFPFIGQMNETAGSFNVPIYRVMMQNFFRSLEHNGPKDVLE
jgi:hypothetical protein